MARILIIEDDAGCRELAAIVCTRGGHDAVAVPDARSAFIELFQGQFDLMITDLVLPDMDGIAITRSLRAVPHWDHMYVLAATALGGEQHVNEMREAGIDAMIQKPYRTRDLLATVEQLLSLPQTA